MHINTWVGGVGRLGQLRKTYEEQRFLSFWGDGPFLVIIKDESFFSFMIRPSFIFRVYS